MRRLDYRFLRGGALAKAAWVFCALALAPVPVQAALRVAWMGLTSADDDYRNETTAMEVTTALYGMLPRNPAVEWVERQQLELAARELKISHLGRRSDAEALRMGKWAKADLLLLGVFEAGKNQASAVRFEVLDLDRAERLAGRVVQPWGERSGTNAPHALQASRVSRELDALLGQALAERERRREQIPVALLFVHTGQERWSGFPWDAGMKHTAALLPRTLDRAFAAAVATNQQFRLVRFSRPARALDEAELALAGLVESDPQAWLRVADYYAWGDVFITNAPASPGTPPRPQASVTIALHVWDGRGEPKTFRDGPFSLSAGGLSEAEVAARCEKLAQAGVPTGKPPATAPAESVRQRVSKLLEAHADTVLGDGFLAVFDSFESQARIGDLIQSLELACFFDPQNQSAQWKLVTHRWGHLVGDHARDEFRFLWRASEAWGRYVGKFGLDSPPGLQDPRRLKGGGVAGEYVNSTLRLAGKFLFWNTVPQDVPEPLLEEWQAQIAAEFVRRAVAVTNRPEMLHAWPQILEGGLSAGARQVVPDPKLRVSLIEAVWPRYVDCAGRTQTTPGLEAIRGGITRAFTAVGRAGEAEKLLALLPVRSAPTPAAPAQHAWTSKVREHPRFNVPRVAALPPKLVAQPEALKLPAGNSLEARHGYLPVHELRYGQGKLWIAAAVEQEAAPVQVNPDLARELPPARGQVDRLFAYDPDTGRFQDVPSPLTNWSALAVTATVEALWVAGEGVARLDLASGTVRKFGVAEGLRLRDVGAVAVAGDRAFAAGGRLELFAGDAQPSRWSPVTLPVASWSTSTGRPMRIVGAHNRLLLIASAVGLYAPATGQWKLLTNAVAVHCAEADGAGFWLGGGTGLGFLDAQTEVLTVWPSETGVSWPKTTYVIAPYFALQPLDALRCTQNPAWGRAEIIRALRQFGEDRQAVHTRRTPAKPGMESPRPRTRLRGTITALASDGDFLWIGCRDYHHYLLLWHKPSRSWVGHLVMPAPVTSLAVSERLVWIGCSGGENRLLQVRKDTLLATPPSQWVKDEIETAEYAAVVAALPQRDQVMLAFLAGDYARAARQIEADPAPRHDLEALFLLAFCYDSLGLDRPELSRACYGEILAEYPDSPWAEVAAEFMKQDEVRHQAGKLRALELARFDRNGDGVVDEAEQAARGSDPEYAQAAAKLAERETLAAMEQIVQRYDRNQDQLLEAVELRFLRQAVAAFVQGRQTLGNLPPRKRLLDPLISERTPAVEEMLKRYDANRDGRLSAAELAALAKELRRN